LEELESAVEGTCFGKIDDALGAGEAFTCGCLIDVWLGLPFHVFAAREGDVDAVEGDEEFFCAPELGKGFDYSFLTTLC
jgi:hypothetical protein